MDKNRKVTVVGAGSVGASYAYALAQSGLADEIVLCDAFDKLAQGQALDLMQGQPFFPQANIHAGSDADFHDSDIIVVTAGSRQQPGESRIDLLKRNAGIVGDIARRVAASGCCGILLIVSNPVDILTKIAVEASQWPRSRVIGSGTVLDTARFRFAIGRSCGVDARNVHGYILGEHGDSEFAAWSMTSVAGQRVGACGDFCCSSACPHCGLDRAAIEKEVRDAAYRIIELKGATYYAIGLALVRITSAILRDENSILSVSVDLQGEFGVKDVCLSVPCVVGRSGVKRIFSATLSDGELASFKASAKRLSTALSTLR